MGAPSESRCRPPARRVISESRWRRLSSGFAAPHTEPIVSAVAASEERVREGGQGTQSRARALDGPGALLTTRWAAYRRGFESRWQPRVVHASKHTCGCPARNLLRRSALSLESDGEAAGFPASPLSGYDENCPIDRILCPRCKKRSNGVCRRCSDMVKMDAGVLQRIRWIGRILCS